MTDPSQGWWESLSPKARHLIQTAVSVAAPIALAYFGALPMPPAKPGTPQPQAQQVGTWEQSVDKRLDDLGMKMDRLLPKVHPK